MTCIHTSSGRLFDLLHPVIESDDLWDIARGLSHTIRFNGQSEHVITVATHSVLASDMVGLLYPGCSDQLRFAALMHDVEESYIGDMISPIKRMFPEFSLLGDNIRGAIHTHFGVHQDDTTIKAVKRADIACLKAEARVAKGVTEFTDHWDLGGYEDVPTYRVEFYHSRNPVLKDSYLLFLQRFFQFGPPHIRDQYPQFVWIAPPLYHIHDL